MRAVMEAGTMATTTVSVPKGGWLRVGLLVPALAAMLACSNSDPTPEPTSTSEPTSAPSTTGASVTTSRGQPPATTVATGPPATKGPKTFLYGPMTFHIPAEWNAFDDLRDGEPVAMIGENAGKGAEALRVMLDYSGTVDALKPVECPGSGVADPAPPAGVDLLESGFAPVGNLQAEFRLWRFTCPLLEQPMPEYRAWLLPVSHIAIFGQRYSPVVAAVLATVEFA